MSLTLCILSAVALQRLAELLYSNRNTKKLLTEGGKEVGQSHYPVMIAIHTGWLFTITTFVVLADTRSVDELIIWPLIGVYGLVQLGRFWVLYSLGRYWSTKVIDLPEAPLIRKGPYRWIKHPNYLIVVLEVALLPMALQMWGIALVFSILNAGILAWRIQVENRALIKRV
jgi:methyltransferase